MKWNYWSYDRKIFFFSFNTTWVYSMVVLEWSLNWMPPRSHNPPVLLPNKWIRTVSASWPT